MKKRFCDDFTSKIAGRKYIKFHFQKHLYLIFLKLNNFFLYKCKCKKY